MPNIESTRLRVWVEGSSPDASLARRCFGRTGEAADTLADSTAVIAFDVDQLDELAATRKPVLVLVETHSRDAASQQAGYGKKNVSFRAAIECVGVKALKEAVEKVSKQTFIEMSDAVEVLKNA